jgi:AhpD family alkylhydroperoxidase
MPIPSDAIGTEETADMTSTTRIPKAEITGVYGRLLKRFSRKMLGDVPEPAEVMWHNRAVLKDIYGLGRKADKWDQLDPNLKSFAYMAVAALVGCTWCLDFGYFHAHDDGLDERKAAEVPRWRESPVFTPLERDVMAYAEAMSETPPQVDDDLSARLLAALGAPAMVELTAWVALANLWTRSNTAFGIEAQGFSAACELPLAPPAARHAESAARRPTRSSRTAACCSPSPTRCWARSPTPRTSSRRRGCAGTASTGRRCATRGRTSSAS